MSPSVSVQKRAFYCWSVAPPYWQNRRICSFGAYRSPATTTSLMD